VRSEAHAHTARPSLDEDLVGGDHSVECTVDVATAEPPTLQRAISIVIEGEHTAPDICPERLGTCGIERSG
jgi:hypothetical protein